MENNLTSRNSIKLTPGSKIKIGRTEYIIFGAFTDDGKEFLMAKYLSCGKDTCYCAIGYEKSLGGYYRHR